MRDAQEEERLEKERSEHLVGRLLLESRNAEFMHLVVISLAAVLLWNEVAHIQLVAWIAAVAGAAVVRGLVRRHLTKKRSPPGYALTNIRRVVVLSALAWAIGPVVFAGSLEIGELALLLVLFAGLVAAATSSDPGAEVQNRYRSASKRQCDRSNSAG